MIKVIICFCLTWQLISSGSARQYCACIRLNGEKIDVLDCHICTTYEELEPEDYRRYAGNSVHPPRPPGSGPQGPPGYADSFFNAVKNTIERRAIYPERRSRQSGSCAHKDRFVFNSEKDVCKLILEISNSNKQVNYSTTTPAPITHIGTTSTSSTTQAANKFESDRRRRTDSDKEGVSVGVVVAIAIICFILGLLTMWLMMRFCIEGFIRRLRHIKNTYKTTHSAPNFPDSERNVNVSEPTNTTRASATHNTNANRTSYEGLRPENRTSSVYNAIDPDYQSTEQNSAAPTTQGTNEYFVLETENEDTGANTSKNNTTDNVANPALRNAPADYLVLEKNDGVNARSNSTPELNSNMDTRSSGDSHCYFVLERQNCDNGEHVSGSQTEGMSNESNPYFVLEKDSNSTLHKK